MKIAIVGAGWAGMAAALEATLAGHRAIVFEAARAIGGRARAMNAVLPDGTPVLLDNGQHILIGAYRESLRLMRLVGVDTQTALLRLPLTLQFADGQGFALPRWPAPLDALGGMLGARGWHWHDKLSLLQASICWQLRGFTCTPGTSVAQLCAGLTPVVLRTLIEPLCVSALNTPPERACGQVFLRVLKDSLLGGPGSSHLLLPRQDLSSLFPEAASGWLQTRGGQYGGHGGEVRLGTRVQHLAAQADQSWLVNGESFDAVVWATSSANASNAAAALMQCAQTAPETIANAIRTWAATAQALQFEAITTVYAYAAGARLPRPMVALRSSADAANPAPAQFAFDRGQLGGPAGLWALVVSASSGTQEGLQAQALAQAQQQLAHTLRGRQLQAVQTVVEKRATFACTPALARPPARIAPGLIAAGDYVDGPYPATLEGAVRSGTAALQWL